MILIDCCPKELSKHVLTVTLNGEAILEIHTSIWGVRPSLDFNSISTQEFLEQFYKQELILGKKYALKALAKSNLHSIQLERKLQEKLVSQTTINQILSDCRRLGFLNDEEWIGSFVRGHSRRYGPRQIAAKLRSKGISVEGIKFQDDETQKIQVKTLLASRYRNRDLSNAKEKNKVVASLLRKGFDYAHIREVLHLEFSS